MFTKYGARSSELMSDFIDDVIIIHSLGNLKTLKLYFLNRAYFAIGKSNQTCDWLDNIFISMH